MVNPSWPVRFWEKSQSLLSDLEEHGLFLVPVGELESWLPIIMKGASRDDKSRWAILAAEKIEDTSERQEGVWKFMRGVHDFLCKRLEQLAMPSDGQAT